MESGWCTLHCMQALFRAVTITGVVVRGFRSSSVPVTHEGYLVESRRPLWFGPHKPIVFSTLSRHSPLATVSRRTSIISLCLGSSASLSSQANCSVFSTLSRHSPLATVSRSTVASIISLCLDSSASLSSPFSRPCYVGSHCSAFLFC